MEPELRAQYGGFFTEFGQVLEKCRFSNPRKIKRILNRYLFFLSKYESGFQDYNKNIVRLIVLAEYYPGLFQLFLRDANEAKKELTVVGKPEFDVKQFEGKFGVLIAAAYPQLAKMSSLFDDLDLPTDPSKPGLGEQAQAVYSITRLV